MSNLLSSVKTRLTEIQNLVRTVGNSLTADFKKNAIPKSRQELLQIFERHESLHLSKLVLGLEKLTPNIPLIGGELEDSAQKVPPPIEAFWVCDLLDGAIQYFNHLEEWCLSLCLVIDGAPKMSFIYSPLLNEFYFASEGEGAYLNGARVFSHSKTDLDAAIITFNNSPLIRNAENSKDISKYVALSLDAGLVVRNFGPTSLQIARVGTGKTDLFWESGLDTFNWLAGILFAQNAGAHIFTLEGESWSWGQDSILVAGSGFAKNDLAPFFSNRTLNERN